ncbi:hypothetical protein SDJN02_07146, partial [Cucurbita argyrosperma subsp. argyrosperma]
AKEEEEEEEGNVSSVNPEVFGLNGRLGSFLNGKIVTRLNNVGLKVDPGRLRTRNVGEIVTVEGQTYTISAVTLGEV